MYYELALISVLVAGAYWGWFFVRHPPSGSLLFGAMQLAAAACAGLGLIGRYTAGPAILGVAGAIGTGTGVCMLIVGPLVRTVARRFASAERIAIALRLLDVAEILSPGSGITEEKAVLRAMREIREGRIDPTVDALTAAKDRASADARLAIDERIAMLYLAAYRWSDAITHAEAHLMGAPTAELAPHPDGQVRPELAHDSPHSLRRTLGVAPPVWVELLGAYGRTGDLDRAGRMLVRLEDVCAGRQDGAMWIHRGRLLFLALAGRTAAVRSLVDPRHSRHMSPAARSYWVAVALEHHGEREAAIAAYAKARRRTRGQPRALIDQAIARVANAEPATLSTEATEVVERVEAAPVPAPILSARGQRPWATRILTGAMLAVAAATWIALGDSTDVGVVIRSGAMVRGFIQHGEWWRLVSCIFVHIGIVHLIVNATGIWFVGRITEDLFGTSRTVALFAVAGLAGSVASYLAAPVGLSAGASGAIFGLLGALFVELSWHRDRHRIMWQRGLWGAVAVITVAQVANGFFYPAIDLWAHGAGLAAGALFGAVFSPNARWSRVALQLARVIAAAFALAAITAAVLVVRTSVADSIVTRPTERHVIEGVALTAPATWQVRTGQLADPDEVVVVVVKREPRTNLGTQLSQWLASRVTGSNTGGDHEQIEEASDPLITLPDGWEGRELVDTVDDAMGETQRTRILVVGRTFGDQVILLGLSTPDSVARALPDFLTELIGSASPI